MDTTELKQHAVNGNVGDDAGDLSKHAKKGAHNSLDDEVPIGLFTHLKGITITIGGMPVDLGLPADINLLKERPARCLIKSCGEGVPWRRPLDQSIERLLDGQRQACFRPQR